MKTLVAIVLGLLVFSSSTLAASSLFSGNVLSRSTSDKQDSNLVSASLRPLSNLLWPYPDEPATRAGWTCEFASSSMTSTPMNYRTFEIQPGYYLKSESQWSLQISAGVHTLSQTKSVNKESTDPIGEIEFQKLLPDGHSFTLQVQSHYALDRIAPVGGDLDNVRSFSLKPASDYFLNKEVKLSYRGHYDWLKDGNLLAITDAQVLKSVGKENLWLWVGGGAEYTTNRQVTSQYYSPSNSTSLGLRYDLSYAFPDTMWTVSSGGSFHILKEQGSGTGHYMNTNIQYGRRDAWQIQLSIETINSLQGSANWSSQGVTLSANKSF